MTTLPRAKAHLESVLEKRLAWPLKARDRVRRATSADGLRWKKDRGFVLTHPSHVRDHMTYRASVDDEAALWTRASVHDPDRDRWCAALGRIGTWRDLEGGPLASMLAFWWHAGRMYAVTATSSGGREIRCLERGVDGWPSRELRQEWEHIGDLAVQDICLAAMPDGLRAWCTVAASDRLESIHAWSSPDGLAWSWMGPALTSPHAGHWFQLADSPSVVALPDGGWRMYFRTGLRPALGNTIRSARSDDGTRWSHEAGDRIAPGGRWDSDGVGFPCVVAAPDGSGWSMYYASYWGRSHHRARTVRRWEAVGEGMRSRALSPGAEDEPVRPARVQGTPDAPNGPTHAPRDA